MRNVNVLLDTMEDINTLCQYLYASEEHSVIIHNSIQVPLEITMDENLVFYVKNLNFPNLPAMKEEFGPERLCQIIECLKEEEPIIIKSGAFANRWEEVRSITRGFVGINAYNRYQKSKFTKR